MTESKRKVAAGDEGDTRSSKRARTLAVEDSPETAIELGLRFLENLRAARDKTGRPISTVFETLPDPKEHPDYYDEIKLPVALDTIEKKLKKREYASLVAVESDFKRLVQNAKSYNEKNSPIYQDAERVRKTASNWMVRNNPAYRSPNYVAVATPIPGDEPNGTPRTVAASSSRPATSAVAAAPASTEYTPRSRRQTITAAPKVQTPQRTRAKQRKPEPDPEPEPEEDEDAEGEEVDENEFEGMTLQDAQLKIMDNLITFVDEESELQIFQPFEWLPSRSLTDYYQIIKYPVSLRSVQKRAKGQVGRSTALGTSEFPTWESFEHEMEYVWNNAWEYNEDGSDISLTAGELKNEFERQVALAKQAVPEPSKPTLKINMSQPKPSGLKLRFGAKASPVPSSDPNTPDARSSATPGVIVDKEALERQLAHVQAGVNGGRPPSNMHPAQAKAPAAVALALGRAPSGAGSPMPNGVHSAVPPSQGIAPGHGVNGVHLGTSHYPGSAMNHLHMHNQLAGGHPSAYGMQHPGSLPQYIPPPNIPQQFPLMRNPSIPSILPMITLTTHPSLSLSSSSVSKAWKLNVPASPTYTNKSVVVSLPASYHTLQLIPTIPVAKSDRPWRLFCIVNGMRITQSIRPPLSATGPTHPGVGEKDKPVFDIRLPPPVGGQVGINRIDVEILAAVKAPAGAKENGAKEDLVVKESCTIFVHLLR